MYPARLPAASERRGGPFAYAHVEKLPQKEQFGMFTAVDVNSGRRRGVSVYGLREGG
jgi:hypothetical protein